jgi:hypothetical protein
MGIRYTIFGNKSAEEVQDVSIRTRCPDKWIFIDTEGGGDIWARENGAFRHLAPGELKLLKKFVKHWH